MEMGELVTGLLKRRGLSFPAAVIKSQGRASKTTWWNMAHGIVPSRTKMIDALACFEGQGHDEEIAAIFVAAGYDAPEALRDRITAKYQPKGLEQAHLPVDAPPGARIVHVPEEGYYPMGPSEQDHGGHIKKHSIDAAMYEAGARYLAPVMDDQLEAAGIHAGDTVYVRPADSAPPGAPAVLTSDGQSTLGLVPDPLPAGTTVVGRVIAVTRTLPQEEE